MWDIVWKYGILCEHMRYFVRICVGVWDIVWGWNILCKVLCESIRYCVNILWECGIMREFFCDGICGTLGHGILHMKYGGNGRKCRDTAPPLGYVILTFPADGAKTSRT